MRDLSLYPHGPQLPLFGLIKYLQLRETRHNWSVLKAEQNSYACPHLVCISSIVASASRSLWASGLKRGQVEGLYRTLQSPIQLYFITRAIGKLHSRECDSLRVHLHLRSALLSAWPNEWTAIWSLLTRPSDQGSINKYRKNRPESSQGSAPPFALQSAGLLPVFRSDCVAARR